MQTQQEKAKRSYQKSIRRRLCIRSNKHKGIYRPVYGRKKKQAKKTAARERLSVIVIWCQTFNASFRGSPYRGGANHQLLAISFYELSTNSFMQIDKQCMKNYLQDINNLGYFRVVQKIFPQLPLRRLYILQSCLLEEIARKKQAPI